MKCRHCGCELLVSALATLSLRPNRFAGSNPFASQSLYKKTARKRRLFYNWSSTTSKPTTPDTVVCDFRFLELIIAEKIRKHKGFTQKFENIFLVVGSFSHPKRTPTEKLRTRLLTH